MTPTLDDGLGEREDGGGRPGVVPRLGATLATLGVAAALVAGCGGAPSSGGGAAGPVMSGARTGTDQGSAPPAVPSQEGQQAVSAVLREPAGEVVGGRGVAQLIRRHPSVTFLLLTFVITCIVWVPRAVGVPVGVVGQV